MSTDRLPKASPEGSNGPRALLLARAGGLASAIEAGLGAVDIACQRADPESFEGHAALDSKLEILVVVDAPVGDWKPRVADAMAQRGSGRIIHVSNAIPVMHAAALASRGVRENLVLWAWLEGFDDSARLGEHPQRSALGRPVTCEEVADAVVFLASPGAGYMVGTKIPVTGGWGLGLFPEQLS